MTQKNKQFQTPLNENITPLECEWNNEVQIGRQSKKEDTSTMTANLEICPAKTRTISALIDHTETHHSLIKSHSHLIKKMIGERDGVFGERIECERCASSKGGEMVERLEFADSEYETTMSEEEMVRFEMILVVEDLAEIDEEMLRESVGDESEGVGLRVVETRVWDERTMMDYTEVVQVGEGVLDFRVHEGDWDSRERWRGDMWPGRTLRRDERGRALVGRERD
ncbi:hypothetical protein Tco_0453042 [Tanacetum coccineum]